VIPSLIYSVSDMLCVEVLLNARNDLYETVVEPFVIAVGFE
jgi:hypothetical protein